MRHTPYYIIIYTILLFCSLTSRAGQPLTFFQYDDSTAYPKRETRAVWLTTLNGLDWPRTKATSAAAIARQKQELRDILDRLQAIHINTILFQTRTRGSVLYPSAIEPWDVALTGQYGKDPGYDPLAFAIDEAHQRGMELHAWVVTIPYCKTDVATKMGKKTKLRQRPDLFVRHNGTWYLNPGLPGTADYLASICREIVGRYDVDGIHFDYIRYPEKASSFADNATYRRYAAKGQSKDEWRRQNITDIVRRIYADVKALKPWVRVSSSPVGKYADLPRASSMGWNARDAVYQDAQGWLRQGIHDMLFPMMYFDGSHFYPFAADWQEHSCGRCVAPGLGIYFLDKREKDWPLTTITRQLHYLREQGLAGQCYFRSRFLTDDVKGIYTYLQQDFYPFPALTPSCIWLDNEAPATPVLHEKRSLDACTTQLVWNSVVDNLGGGVRYNIYASQQWPVSTDDPRNIVATALTDTTFTCSSITNRFLGYHLAITAIDRCGNESEPCQVDTFGGRRPTFNFFRSVLPLRSAKNVSNVRK